MADQTRIGGTLTLAKPLEQDRQPVKRIVLREMKAGDIAQCGTPFIVKPTGDIEINAAAMNRMLAALTGLRPKTIANLAAVDWASASSMVMDQFNAICTAQTTALGGVTTGGDMPQH